MAPGSCRTYASVVWARGSCFPARCVASSVPAEARGKAFGFHRASDTVGAVIGPLIGVCVLEYLHPRAADLSEPFRVAFFLTLIPGLGACVAFVALVRETRQVPAESPFWTAIAALPRPFRRLLWGVGIFGMGDFARTLMILAATQLLATSCGLRRATQIAGLLYVGHNVIYAACSYPVGAISDQIGRRGLLSLGYLAGALASLGFFAAFRWKVRFILYFLALFGLSGFSISTVDALEGVLTADLVDEDRARGTAYGVLGSVNGAGDLVASVLVGTLWTALSPALAFACAALLMCLGALVVYQVR
jgi:MFS family permease